MSEVRSAPVTGHWHRVAAVVLGGIILVFLSAALAWRVTGGSWQIVSTPSMGAAAPVGTLVLTRPTSVRSLQVGDVITFHPPGTNRTFTHRVVAIDADGGLHTRGDLNSSADPWVVHDPDLVGKVTARWWGVGWLVRAIPILVVGGVVVWFATRTYANDRWRSPLRIVGFSLVTAVAAFLVKPFVRIVVLSTGADGTGAHATVVSTGLLPIRVAVPHGTWADLRGGHLGTVSSDRLTRNGSYHLTSSLHMGWPWWVALIGVCCIPLLWSLTVGGEPVPPVSPATG